MSITNMGEIFAHVFFVLSIEYMIFANPPVSQSPQGWGGAKELRSNSNNLCVQGSFFKGGWGFDLHKNLPVEKAGFTQPTKGK
jgi:hypothetical protein